MKIVKEPNPETIREALAALEQAFGYYTPPPAQPDKEQARDTYYEYHSAA